MPLKDPEAERAYQARYYEENREALRARRTKHYEENREAIAAYNTSPKGRARYTRYRTKNVETIRAKARAGGPTWATRRRRQLGQQRAQVLEQLAALQEEIQHG